MEGGEGGDDFGGLSAVILTVLVLHWLVAGENLISKGDLTTQALNKLLKLQRTLTIEQLEPC